MRQSLNSDEWYNFPWSSLDQRCSVRPGWFVIVLPPMAGELTCWSCWLPLSKQWWRQGVAPGPPYSSQRRPVVNVVQEPTPMAHVDTPRWAQGLHWRTSPVKDKRSLVWEEWGDRVGLSLVQGAGYTTTTTARPVVVMQPCTSLLAGTGSGAVVVCGLLSDRPYRIWSSECALIHFIIYCLLYIWYLFNIVHVSIPIVTK